MKLYWALIIGFAWSLEFTTSPDNQDLMPDSVETLTWTLDKNPVDCIASSYLGELKINSGASIDDLGTSDIDINDHHQVIKLTTSLNSIEFEYRIKKFYNDNTGENISHQAKNDIVELQCWDGSEVAKARTIFGVDTDKYPGSGCPEVGTSPNNKVCNGKGHCNPVDSTCKCYNPYWGDDCSKKACNVAIQCDSAASCDGCFNGGSCDSSTGTCNCATDAGGKYSSHSDKTSYGDYCQYKYCPNDCNSKGDCDRHTGICSCYPGFTGESCEIFECPNDCNQNGKCDGSNGNCSCYDGYFGYDCAFKRCPRDCGANGGCNFSTGECTCYNNFYGDDCMFSTCPGSCSGNGICDPYSGRCNCNDGYGGVDCSIDLSS